MDAPSHGLPGPLAVLASNDSAIQAWGGITRGRAGPSVGSGMAVAV